MNSSGAMRKGLCAIFSEKYFVMHYISSFHDLLLDRLLYNDGWLQHV